ncbi:ribosome biogenesis factor YjgA [Celerinatantimonas sp. YJH-8]|uniref:ribosome biogenesis factor YjgA n=1 Tax=Celerinatantimonas sp. YJH-8 TaxID=3228714 RepID=UPI0038C142CA
MSETPNNWQDDDDDWISKSQLKREAQQLKVLGQEICQLNAERLATIPLSEAMLDAVALAKRISNKREALRRHMNYIGKLMREEDLEAIEAALDKIRNRHLYENQRQHKLEMLRDKLIQSQDSEAQIQSLLDAHPFLERQKLRQLIRQAKKELAENTPPKSSRELFRYLRENIHEADD